MFWLLACFSKSIWASPGSADCGLLQILDLRPNNGPVLRRLLVMHVGDDIVREAAKQYYHTPGLKLIGGMHGAGW